MVVLDEALDRLAAEYPRQAQVVELRFFGGLNNEEAVEVLRAGGTDVSLRTVERDWRFARAWLEQAMGPVSIVAPHQPDRTAEIFDRLLDLPVEQRGAALAAECHGDSELCARVEALLRADEAAAARTLWQGSALDAQAKLVARHDPDAQAGLRLGAYRVVKTLGQGGMGTVYLAVRDDDAYEKRVAIKLIQHGLDSEEALRRFRSERQILAQMEHPNIARLIDGGNTADGLPYLVMEHVNGIP